MPYKDKTVQAERQREYSREYYHRNKERVKARIRKKAREQRKQEREARRQARNAHRTELKGTVYTDDYKQAYAEGERYGNPTKNGTQPHIDIQTRYNTKAGIDDQTHSPHTHTHTRADTRDTRADMRDRGDDLDTQWNDTRRLQAALPIDPRLNFQPHFRELPKMDTLYELLGIRPDKPMFVGNVHLHNGKLTEPKR